MWLTIEFSVDKTAAFEYAVNVKTISGHKTTEGYRKCGEREEYIVRAPFGAPFIQRGDAIGCERSLNGMIEVRPGAGHAKM